MNGVSGAIGSLFGGNSDQKEVVVNVQRQQDRSQQQAQTSYADVKQEVFQLIRKGERLNILPDDAAEESREALGNLRSDAREAWRDLNLDQNIDRFFNDIEVDLDDNGDLDISVDGEYFQKDEMKEYLADNTDLSEAEINGIINKWDRKIDQAVQKAEELYAEAKQKAEKYSDQFADAMAKACIWAFVAMLFGLLAAAGGGFLGSPKHAVREVE